MTAVGSSWTLAVRGESLQDRTCGGLDVGSEKGVKGESLFLPQQLENGGRSLCTGSISHHRAERVRGERPAAGAPSCPVFQGWADEEGTVREAEKEQPVRWENRGCPGQVEKTILAGSMYVQCYCWIKQEKGPLDLALQVIGDLG